MDRKYEIKYHRMEENSWWFFSRRKMLLQMIDSYNLDKNSKILEIGCSGGPLMLALKKKGYKNVFGIDISSPAIALCKKRRISNVSVMDAAKLKFSNNSFDLIIASDVLEHIENDSKALLEWQRALKPHGKMIIFVPAFRSLWTDHDRINHHFRRYDRNVLESRVKKAKLRLTRNSYWNFTLFFPIMLMRKIRVIIGENGSPKDQVYEVNPIVNKFLIMLLSLENWMLKFIKFPVGVSVFVECQK